ncbi:putative domain, di-copper centre, Polyphenol oxidase [Artemisia annua]|uniref:Putative domain, di-copper centre, Polyphenol oxidase n=1 Tax=Artemisia annua TaxID=35608 RepID=A0A2U1KQI7_ARTAN|nr:putative domain, di-copper centre, Polyphenol oxidase [Artemisia annua]
MSSTLVPLTSTFTSVPKQLATSTNSQFISKARTNQTHGFKVSCNALPQDNENQLILPETQKLILPNNNVDRRNLLVGLGGMYTAANLTSLPSAFASPITAPDITNVCNDSASGFNTANAIRTGKCCPPNLGKKVKEFTFPTETTTRVRWPAHLGTQRQVSMYTAALAIMRALPDDDPHSFAIQAKIHCAYCNGGYTQRILGEPTFALPYWNWDDPVGGMKIPDFFLLEFLPSYDAYRDARHEPPLLVDLAFDGRERFVSNEVQTQCNLSIVYRDLVRNGTDSKSFFGGEYVAGDAPVNNGAKSIGSVEAGTHTAVHRWVGDSTKPNNEDMGNFTYSAGYDPLFYVHHANVDRMWKLWKDLGIKGRNEPTDRDWLDASYVFYDENMDLVRVYNRDCANIDKLKYDYFVTEGETAWRNSQPGKRNKNEKPQTVSIAEVKTVEQLTFPVGVDPELKVRVKRPAVNITNAEKGRANKILLINGIRFNSDKFVKFDVFVNDNVEDGKLTTPCDPEYAGGFSQVPHNDNMKMLMTSAARFGLDEILEDTNTEGEEYALVTLVARAGCDDLTVEGIKIELVPY